MIDTCHLKKIAIFVETEFTLQLTKIGGWSIYIA